MGNIEKTELTVMCMICDGTKILVQDRVNKDWPGVTFPGGHVEPGEAFTDAVRREVKEETGLDISRPTVCGINDFVRDDGTRYIVLFFRPLQRRAQKFRRGQSILDRARRADAV